jgi:hypothetical protein
VNARANNEFLEASIAAAAADAAQPNTLARTRIWIRGGRLCKIKEYSAEIALLFSTKKAVAQCFV